MQVRSPPTTSGLETEWDYSGRKGRDGQKKKIGKANERKRKGGKRWGSKWTRGKRGAPVPHGAPVHWQWRLSYYYYCRWLCGCVCTVPGLGEASRQLVIIPDDETFVKPLGASMVLTCRVVTSGGHRAPDGSQLQWIDDDNQAIVDINGRFHPTCCVLCYNVCTDRTSCWPFPRACPEPSLGVKVYRIIWHLK